MRTKLFRELTAAWLVAALLLQSATAVAPEWWATRGVLTPGAAADDYAVANVGQLKNIARKAAQEMSTKFPGGAGADIRALIATWEASPAQGAARDDYAAVTLGQIKAVAVMFYDRLAVLGAPATGGYPWSHGVQAPDDYALANLGQLKHAFAFDIPQMDANQNGLPDAWEMQMFGNLDQTTEDDFDYDGLNNREEWQAGTRADLADTDADGWDDWTEMNYGGDPKQSSRLPSGAVVAAYGTYDTDSFLANDTWWVAEDTQPNDAAHRWYSVHRWFYPGSSGLDSGFQAQEPGKVLRSLPTSVSEQWWHSEAVGAWRWDWHDADKMDTLSPVPNGAYFPIINRWDETESSGDHNYQELGWGVNWKRYRLRVPAPLSEDYEETYLKVTYQWDKASAVWTPYYLWDIYSDGYWTYPAPTIKTVEAVKMKLPKGQIVGEWLYVMPTTEEDEMLSVHLCPIEFLAPEVPEQPADQTPSLPLTEPLAAGGDASTPSNSQSSIENQTAISDAAFHPVKELKIAKLTDALKPVDTSRPVDKTNKEFKLDCSSDTDAFRVRIDGLPRNPSMRLTLHLSTYGAPAQGQFAPIHDDATEIPMRFIQENGHAYYSTSRQFLVAHQEDDAYPAGRNISPTPSNNAHQIFGLDDQDKQGTDPMVPSDRTHRAVLGSNIKVDSISISGVPNSGSFPLHNVSIPVKSRRTVKVAVYVFTDSGAMSGNDFRPAVMENFRRARDLFAQVGVAVELADGFPVKVEPPKDELGASLGSSVGAHVPGQVGVPTVKGKLLIDACIAEKASTADVSLIYCSDVLKPGGGGEEEGYYGYAYPVSAGAGGYSNWAFVAGASIGNSVMVFGHELGHLITNAGHFGTNYPLKKDGKTLLPVGPIRLFNNLMQQGKGSGAPGIGNGCRLEQLQENMINGFLKK